MSDLSSQSASPPPQLGFGMPPGINTPGGMSTPGLGLDEEIIPTAIVIKNIPFNVKRESLLDIIVSHISMFLACIDEYDRLLSISQPLMPSTTT
jgi:hypothetical protein